MPIDRTQHRTIEQHHTHTIQYANKQHRQNALRSDNFVSTQQKKWPNDILKNKRNSCKTRHNGTTRHPIINNQIATGVTNLDAISHSHSDSTINHTYVHSRCEHQYFQSPCPTLFFRWKKKWKTLSSFACRVLNEWLAMTIFLCFHAISCDFAPFKH